MFGNSEKNRIAFLDKKSEFLDTSSMNRKTLDIQNTGSPARRSQTIYRLTFVCMLLVILLISQFNPSLGQSMNPIIIAHRGASGYVPEHTLEGVAMAHAFGADFIEQDLVLSKDDIPVVLHDIDLEPVTNVAEKFPDRKRSDGKYYAIDFTLAELKSLNVHERINLKNGEKAFPIRFPLGQGRFQIPTLEEELQLIQGLNQSRKHQAGIYPEIKSPAFHRSEGKDLSAITLEILKKYGYAKKTDSCFVQCFDWEECKAIRKLGYQGKLIFLTGGKEAKLDQGKPAPFNSETMRIIAAVADGIGPSLSLVVSRKENGDWEPTPFIAEAHQAGLQVHPYTIRADVPMGHLIQADQMFDLILGKAMADGVFTDHPDQGVLWKIQR